MYDLMWLWLGESVTYCHCGYITYVAMTECSCHLM